MLRLKSIKLLRESVVRWNEYPFNIPPIASLDALEITSRICFFVGKNGSGKSGSRFVTAPERYINALFSDKCDAE
jgi:predicted ATPase